MARTPSIVALVSIACVLALAPRVPAQGDRRDPLLLLPDTTARIIPFADQLAPGYSERLVRFVATHYAGAQKMLKADNDRFRAINPRWLLLHYRLGASSGPVPYIHGNRWTSDWNEVNAHEDWFLHNERGQRHYDAGSNWYLHDPQNAAFREYWVNGVIADMRATGAQGVFADSFDAGVSGYGVTPPDVRFAAANPAEPSRWPGGVSWQAQKLAFVDFVVSRFRATPERFLFVPNLATLTTTWWWPGYEHIDGAMLENFALNANPVDWVMSIDRALGLTRAGKFVIVQAYPKDLQERLFLIGSYLLIKGQRTFINAAGGGVYYFPEYSLALGPPLAALPTRASNYMSGGIYRRDFRDGSVLVNPSIRNVSLPRPQGLAVVTLSGGGQTTDAQINARGEYAGGSLAFSTPVQLLLPPRSAVLLVRQTTPR